MAMTQTHASDFVGTAPRTFNAVDWTAMALLIIGGINWGLIGLTQFDLVAALFGGQEAMLSRIVYIAVGLSALYCIYTAMKMSNRHART